MASPNDKSLMALPSGISHLEPDDRAPSLALWDGLVGREGDEAQAKKGRQGCWGRGGGRWRMGLSVRQRKRQAGIGSCRSTHAWTMMALRR